MKRERDNLRQANMFASLCKKCKKKNIFIRKNAKDVFFYFKESVSTGCPLVFAKLVHIN